MRDLNTNDGAEENPREVIGRSCFRQIKIKSRNVGVGILCPDQEAVPVLKADGRSSFNLVTRSRVVFCESLCSASSLLRTQTIVDIVIKVVLS